MSASASTQPAEFALWEFTRADGHVFRCALAERTRSWILMLACNGLVFGQRGFESRNEAQHWADEFLAQLAARPSAD